MIMVLRKRNVSRVANNVDDARIAGIEALVALDNSRPRYSVEVSLGGCFRIGDQVVDISKSGRLLRKHQVSKKKASPGIAGFRK
jgi:hypothetical protein